MNPVLRAYWKLVKLVVAATVIPATLLARLMYAPWGLAVIGWPRAARPCR